MSDLARQIITIVAVAVTLIVNGLANALPLNGQTTGSISDRFDVLFVPAGYVFAIWGLIYILLIAYAVYQALPSQRENPDLRAIFPWFVLSCVANSVWIFLWHYNLFPLSLVVMLILLASLIVIYLRLGIGLRQPDLWTWLCVDLTFSVYLGWITVATVANATAVLDYLNWGRFGLSAETWMLIILAAVTAIAAGVALQRRDIPYLLVILWSLVGITVKQADTPIIVNATWVATGVVALFTAWAILDRLRHRRMPVPQ